jgi:putative ABC transport system ATP-binding protein
MALLEIEGLVKGYRTPAGDDQVVLEIPEFRLEPGEQVALAGGSGSGKTTLLNLVAGILRPDAGSIRLDGSELVGLAESARDRLRAERIGYVFQTFNLLPAYTALENVLLGMMFGPGPDRDLAAELLTSLGLGDRLAYRPPELSVGQQQRVALARALANRPRLVLADEPTGNLDARRAAGALTLLRDACKDHDAALLLVSHDPTVLAAFDRVVRLEELNRAGGTA